MYLKNIERKSKGVQYLSSTKKTVDERKVDETIESDKDDKRRMALESDKDEQKRMSHDESEGRIEHVNIDRKMKVSRQMSENSCSLTVSVDELCLKNLTCVSKRDADELPQLSIQIPLGTSM